MSLELDTPATIAPAKPLDLTDLDTFLSEMADTADCKCESTHSSGFPCSGSVVGRKTVGHRNFSFLVCQNSWDWNMARIADEYWGICSGCKRLCRDCWSLQKV